MRLTPELFEQLTGFKESSLEQLEPKKENDVRAAPRLPLAFRSSACRIDGDRFDPPIQIQICDISVNGVELTHAAQDRLGKTFVIAIRPRSKGDAVAIHCEMTKFQSAGQTLIRVGAKFIRLGTEKDARLCLGLSPVVSPAAVNRAPDAPPAHPTSSPNSAAVKLRALNAAATPGYAAPAARPEPDEVKRIRDAMLS